MQQLGALKGETLLLWDWTYTGPENDLTAIVTDDWLTFAAPFLDACTDAASMVRFQLGHMWHLELLGSTVRNAIRCGDPELIEEALARLLTSIRRHEEHAPDELRGRPLVAFAAFANALDDADLSPGSRRNLHELANTVDPPTNDTARGWYDPLVRASDPGHV